MSGLSPDNKLANIKMAISAAKAQYPDRPLYAQLTACQAILEAGLLNTPPSSLALKYNNLFGIKGEGSGKKINGKFQNTVILPTHEFYNGAMHLVDQKFAVNASVEDSFSQHDHLLRFPRYAKLAAARTFSEIAYFIKECGYATDNHYPEKLIALYNHYNIGDQ